jgi:hypothetical protein
VVGNCYLRQRLSPLAQLHDTLKRKRWCQEIVDVLERHFDSCRHLYLAGSGDGLFYLVEAAIRAALEAKFPVPNPKSRSRSRAGAVWWRFQRGQARFPIC